MSWEARGYENAGLGVRRFPYVAKGPSTYKLQIETNPTMPIYGGGGFPYVTKVTEAKIYKQQHIPAMSTHGEGGGVPYVAKGRSDKNLSTEANPIMSTYGGKEFPYAAKGRSTKQITKRKNPTMSTYDGNVFRM